MDANKLQSFRYWLTQDVERTFGIELVETHELLEKWLAVDCEISDFNRSQIKEMQEELRKRVNFWNESELSFHFLAPFIRLVKFNTDKYSAFLESKLSVSVDQQIVQGKVDFLIATGKQIPIAPFFAFHEYKPQLAHAGDPLGQLLMAMIAAQEENKKQNIDIPLYGTYVIGRFFFFVVLHEKKYAVSLAYDATQEDIYQIFCIFKEVKKYIDQRVATM